MIRYRLASVALAAGLGLLQGCQSSGCSTGWGIGNGQLLSKLGFGRHGSCECSTVSASGGVVIDGGNGPACEGPLLDSQGPSTLPPFGAGGEPPIAPAPRLFVPQQAQPVPAPPVSRVKVIDPTQK